MHMAEAMLANDRIAPLFQFFSHGPVGLDYPVLRIQDRNQIWNTVQGVLPVITGQVVALRGIRFL
jgi:hypothetical protein